VTKNQPITELILSSESPAGVPKLSYPDAYNITNTDLNGRTPDLNERLTETEGRRGFSV